MNISLLSMRPSLLTIFFVSDKDQQKQYTFYGEAYQTILHVGQAGCYVDTYDGFVGFSSNQEKTESFDNVAPFCKKCVV